MMYAKNNGEIIQVVHFTRVSFDEVWNFTGGDVDTLVIGSATLGDASCMLRKTDYGDIEIQEGDYVIKNIRNRFYAMKPDMFEIYHEYVPTIITDIIEEGSGEIF